MSRLMGCAIAGRFCTRSCTSPRVSMYVGRRRVEDVRIHREASRDCL